MQQGNYTFDGSYSLKEVVDRLEEGGEDSVGTRVTIPEGYNMEQIIATLEEKGVTTREEFLDAAANGDYNYDYIGEKGDALRVQGYLFPETYEFYTDATVYDIVDTLYAQFDSETADLMDTIAEKGTTLDEVVILASFIQEEAGLPAEDYKVSACFHNRLESDDPLWAEHRLESNASSYITNDGDNNYLWNSPMAEYMGWPEAGAIPEEVLNAYDTYRISGLPAGAISNPGFAAIDAALNPDEEFMAEGYFFFVTGAPGTDVEGQYLYAKTADEHYQNCVIAGWA